MLKRLLSIKPLLLAALIATTFAAGADADSPARPEAKATPPVPLLWKVSDQDNAVYLLGSFHLLRPSDYPLSGDVSAAFEDAEAVVFELSPAEMASSALPTQMMQAALRQDGKSLQDDLDAATWQKLQNYANQNNLPLANFATFEPWFVGLSISILEMTKQGLDPKLGLDTHFMEIAKKAGKPTDGLELAGDQIRMLDGMDAVEQRQFIAEALEQAEKGPAEMEALHRAWRNGDADLLWSKMAGDMKREYPRLYQRINVDRNDAWLPKIQQRLSQSDSDDTLVVVGALHLLGSDGVVEKLRGKGYKVERVCSVCESEIKR
ncbi:TraB/GumN family protein [Pseudoxanthomonas sp. UTMC 1351]|uniref:TraB/GumN family protein n=1 Tax=Pseudoxanthomonas sp. UTMC 1351 TaxID=2695853 RepID=UPI0034CF14BC